jgi:hypothetical protein
LAGILETVWAVLINPYVLAAIGFFVMVIAFFTLPMNIFFALTTGLLLIGCVYLWFELQKALRGRPVDEWIALARRQLYLAAYKMRFMRPLPVLMRRYRFGTDQPESERERFVGRCLGAGLAPIAGDIASQADSENPLELTPAFELTPDEIKEPVYVLAMEKEDKNLKYDTIFFVPFSNIDTYSLDESGDIHEGNPLLLYGALRVLDDGIFAVINSMKKNQLDLCKAALATTCSDAALIRSFNKYGVVSELNSRSKSDITDTKAERAKEANL